MSALGTLRANFPSVALSTRMPTVQDDGQGRGNGGNGFLSLIGESGTAGTAATSGGNMSISADIGPKFAYQAALIGSMLNDVGNGKTGGGQSGGGQSVDGNPPGNALVGPEVEPVAGVATSPDETTAVVVDDVTNDLPLKGSGDFYSPIGRPVADDVNNDLV